MRLRVRSLASLSGLRILRCRELWCKVADAAQIRVAVAVAVAGGYSSDSTPSLGSSPYASGAGFKRQKDKKKKKKKKKWIAKYICSTLRDTVVSCSAPVTNYLIFTERIQGTRPEMVAGDGKGCWNPDGWGFVTAPGSKRSPRVKGTGLS